MNIFLSVGSTFTPEQELFVTAIESRLRAEGLIPQTVGRNYFTADSPFTGVNDLMATCHGIVVVALERLSITSGVEKRGSSLSMALSDVKIATPWNHIEAALAYARNLPILVIVENGVRQDGLLEKGFDWYVISSPLDASTFSTPEFNGVFAAWRQKLNARPPIATKIASPADMTITQLLGNLKPQQLWGCVVGALTALGAAFAAGSKLLP